jgi:hypothetical protein
VDVYGTYNQASVSTDHSVLFDITAPSVSFSSVSPVSPGSSLMPTLFGATSEASIVTLYFDFACTTARSSSVNSSVFAASGIALSSPVSTNMTTTIYAQAFDAAGNASLCTSMVAYTHDGSAPTVTSVNSSTANGFYKAGDVISIQVLFSESIVVSGVPQLTVATGGNGVANYSSGSGSSVLEFTYTVEAGQNSVDLDYLSTSALSAGVYIRDGAGNDAIRTLPAVGASGSLGSNKDIFIDTTIPTISFNSISPSSPGTSLTPTLTMTLSETSKTGGLRLFSDSSCTIAISSATTGAIGLKSITSNSLTSNSTTIIRAAMTDLAGNSSACVTLVSYTHDSQSPSVTSVTTSNISGVYSIGSTISISVSFDEAVSVSGNPTLSLNTSPSRSASYYSGSGTSTLVFRYSPVSGDAATRLDYVATSSLSGTIIDLAGNAAALTLPTVGTSGLYAANLVINTTMATVVSVNSTLANGSYRAGQVVPIQIKFSDLVTVTGVPTLSLNTVPTRIASYVSGSSSSTLVFNYTVQSGDVAGILDYANENALSLAGGTIVDSQSVDVSLGLPAIGSGGSLGVVSQITIDTTSPTVTNVIASSPNGSYSVGSQILINVNFSEVVNVTGSPRIQLNVTNNAATVRYATYSSGSGTGTLVFSYVVQGPVSSAGDQSPDLDYTSSNALTLNGGAITDQAGNQAVLSLASPGAAYSLGYNSNIFVDSSLPNSLSISGVTCCSVSPLKAGSTEMTVSYPLNSNAFTTVKIVRALGADAPSDCSSGTVAKTYSGPFTDGAQVSFVDKVAVFGQAVSYRVCGLDSAGFTLATSTAVNIATSKVHFLFASSTTVTGGSFGGVTAANNTCQTAGNTFDSTLTWRALISDATMEAAGRIPVAGPIYNTAASPKAVAMDYSALWSGNLAASIAYSQTGGAVTGAAWTGTAIGGSRSSTNCSNWSNTAGVGDAGSSISTSSTWLNNAATACNTSGLRFYCYSLAMQPLTSFSVSTPSSGNAGDVTVNMNFPTDTANWKTAEVRRILGKTAPTCSTGTVVKTFDGTTAPFTSGSFTDATGTPSAFYSYAVCVYSGTNTLAATYTHATNGYVRTRRTTGSYIIFVNNATTKGNISSATADSNCQLSGNAIIGSKTWRAVLSTGGTLSTRLNLLSGYDVRNLAGGLVATSSSFLSGGTLTNAVSYTKTFTTSTAAVWTGFTSSGASDANNCSNWTSAAGGTSGVTGLSGSTATNWISNQTQTCNKSYGYYCMSTSTPD